MTVRIRQAREAFSEVNVQLYQVSYWSEGPGRSHTESVVVAAKSKQAAIKHVIEQCGIYKADRPYVRAIKLTQKIDAVIIRHLESEF